MEGVDGPSLYICIFKPTWRNAWKMSVSIDELMFHNYMYIIVSLLMSLYYEVIVPMYILSFL